MKLVNIKNRLEIVIEDDLLSRLGEIANAHFPREFGGFLLGNYSADLKTLIITDFILPKEYKSSPFGFERHSIGTEDEFRKRFIESNEFYVGEWHSHPNGSSQFSSTDLRAMINTADCESVQIRNPILLILSVNGTEMLDYTFYYFENNGLLAYE